MNATTTHGLGDDILQPVDTAVDALMGDPSVDLTNRANSLLAQRMKMPSSKPDSLPNFGLIMAHQQDGPTYSPAAVAAGNKAIGIA